MTNETLKNIGKRLASARKSKGYTQEQLANLTGLSVKMFSEAENGHNVNASRFLRTICYVGSRLS